MSDTKELNPQAWEPEVQEEEEEQQKSRLPVKPIKAIKPERPKASWTIRIVIICLLGVGAYGGYFGYCKYKVNEKKYAFSKAYQDLYMACLRRTTQIRAADIRAVVEQFVNDSGVSIYNNELDIMLEPMNQVNLSKLPALPKMGIGIAIRVGDKQQRFIGGFKGRFLARHGRAWAIFPAQRYTYFKELVVAKELRTEPKSEGP